MSGLLERVLGLPGWAVLLTVGALVFAEDALFVGFVLPGETAAVLGGVAAKLGHTPLWAVLPVVVLCAIVGDSVGYEVGRRAGPRLLQTRALRRRAARIDSAKAFLARRGGSAVLLARWVAFFRAVMPALAGAAGLRYRTFLAFNAAGGLFWGVTVVLLGYLAGASYRRLEHSFGQGTALVAAGLVVVALVVWRVRGHRRRTRAAS